MARTLDQTRDRVRALIRLWGGRLLPTAADELSALWARDGDLPRPALVAKVARGLAHPEMQKRYASPEWVEPPLANGAPASPARVAVRIFQAELKGGAAGVDQLTARWGSDLGRLKPEEMVAEVARRLDRPENRSFLASPGAAPADPQADRVRDLVERHFPGELHEEGKDRLARALGPAIAGRPEHEAVREIARQLAMGAAGASYMAGGEPLGRDDPRHRQQPATPEAAPGEAAPGRSLVV